MDSIKPAWDRCGCIRFVRDGSIADYSRQNLRPHCVRQQVLILQNMIRPGEGREEDRDGRSGFCGGGDLHSRRGTIRCESSEIADVANNCPTAGDRRIIGND